MVKILACDYTQSGANFLPHCTEAANNINYLRTCKGHFFICGVTPQGKAQRPMGLLIVQTNTTKNVGGLYRSRCAGGAGGYGQISQSQHQGFRVYAVKGKIQNTGNSLALAAIETDAIEGVQTSKERLPECFQLPAFFLKRGPGNGEGRSHSNELMSGQGSGPHSSLVPATMNLGLNANVGRASHVEGTNTFRPVDLVSGKRQQIHRHGGNINHHLAGGLGSVNVKKNAPFTQFGTNGSNIRDGSQLIIHQHQADQNGIVPECAQNLITADRSIGGGIQPGHFRALALQPFAGIHDRLVLNLRGNNVSILAAGNSALDSQVIRLCGS